MRRNSMMTVKKSLAVMAAAVMVMSQGVAAYAATDPVEVGVTADATTEDVKKTEDKVEVKDESGDGAIGIVASSNEGHEAKVTVDGGVVVEESGSGSGQGIYGGTAYGIEAEANNEAKTTVEVGGDVSVNSESGDAHGIGNELGNGSTIEISVGGNLDVEAGNNAWGLSLLGGDEDSELKATIEGGITVDSDGDTSEGINIETAGKASVTVGGDVTSSGNGIMAVSYGGEKNEVSVTVGGNVTAGDAAIVIFKGSDESKIDLTVEGTVQGKESNIVFSDYFNEGVKTEGLEVTVWKIDTSNKKGFTAELETSEGLKDYSDEAAEIINYIIKVDDTSKLTPSADKAKEGQQVFLEVNVPSGYDIDSFYTAEGGTAVDVVKDSSGKYYLVVPRGGGVFVGVSLKANSNSKRYNDDNQPGPTESDGDGSGSGNSKRSEVPGRMGPGSPDNLGGKVNAGQTVRVGGQEINTNVIVKDAGEAVKNTFTATLSTTALTGLFDFGGAFVAVPADAAVKESFTFTAEGLDGFVTTYLEIADYKTGDVILCSYMDASGAMVTLVVTPDMINGTTLLLTIPANCTLALAGSSV